MLVQPLTRRYSKGEPYQRSDSVTSQIKTALNLSPIELIKRAKVSDPDSPEYFQEECLIYLIRHHLRKNQNTLVEALSEVLIDRSAKLIELKLNALPTEMLDDAFRKVIARIFEPILDLESDKADILEVKYWVFLQRRIFDTFREFIRLQKLDEKLVSLSVISDENINDESNRSNIYFEDVAEPGLSVEELFILQEGLNVLKDPQRTAFVLHYYYNWPIESIDPSQPTISKYFKKTSRTIRYWLKQAEDQLKQWRGNDDKSRVASDLR